jgi:hypothetical protein
LQSMWKRSAQYVDKIFKGTDLDKVPSEAYKLHRLYDRLSRMGRCADCSRRFPPDAPVWRCNRRLGYDQFGRHHTVVSVCDACWQASLTFELDGIPHTLDSRETYSGNCPACRRLVYQTDWRAYHHHYCCDRCRRYHESGFQAALVRQARAEARGPSRPCAQCGEPFEPRRDDAQFCSPRCRQKAYRKRVTDNNKVGGRENC